MEVRGSVHKCRPVCVSTSQTTRMTTTHGSCRGRSASRFIYVFIYLNVWQVSLAWAPLWARFTALYAAAPSGSHGVLELQYFWIIIMTTVMALSTVLSCCAFSAHWPAHLLRCPLCSLFVFSFHLIYSVEKTGPLGPCRKICVYIYCIPVLGCIILLPNEIEILEEMVHFTYTGTIICFKYTLSLGCFRWLRKTDVVHTLPWERQAFWRLSVCSE